MIPAYRKKVPKKWFVIMAISYHLNGSTETHLKKVNGYQENGCGHLSPRPREK
jgi:hypothetical protein